MEKSTANGRRRKRTGQGRRAASSAYARSEPDTETFRDESTLGLLIDGLGAIGGLTSGLTSSALRIASRTRKSAARVISRTPEQLRMMASAGESLRDIREVTGMTVNEIASALNLRDKSVWEAIEDGREVISFELILRLAALVARNDPLPFIVKYTHSYHPRLWSILHDLKLDRLSLHFGRERSFINIYRRHDSVRELSDAEFERILQFTQQAFDLAMHYIVDTDETRPENAAPGADEASAAAPKSRNGRKNAS